ncbi:heavy metal-binding domain-containing protein [Pedobacter frigidisoli]|uniref:heavy metal-binding domain-containing protein n=1 Tax=Pedobacter frigidisoli TaxID=2530455 RepID=UPI001CED05A4|nr:heavy metal-binding domain-containing protein [Pedobacter frigidisoli]
MRNAAGKEKKPATVKKTPPKKSSTSKKPVPPTKQATDKMEMDNSKAVDNKSTDVKSTTYTCPMHPEIRQDAPGKCPKCGMKLIPEKPKTEKNDHDGMDMGKGTQKVGMEGMDMGDTDATMANIKKAKINLGPIRTITNNAKPRTVRYDLTLRIQR